MTDNPCAGEHCCCCGPGQICCDCGETMPLEATTLISTQIIRDALGFPEDVEILGEESGNVRLTVRSDRLPKGCDEVVAVWVRKGPDIEEFLCFEPLRT